MPEFEWQQFVALVAVAGAAWFLVRRGWKLLRPDKSTGSACGSCGSCATGKNETGGPVTAFVSLESLAASDRKN